MQNFFLYCNIPHTTPDKHPTVVGLLPLLSTRTWVKSLVSTHPGSSSSTPKSIIMYIAAKSPRQLAPTVGKTHARVAIQAGSSPAIGGRLVPRLIVRFGRLDFLANDSAWHPTSAALPVGLTLSIGSLHFLADSLGLLCLQDPVPHQAAELTPRQPLGSPPTLHDDEVASQLICMIGSESLLPVLDSKPDG